MDHRTTYDGKDNEPIIKQLEYMYLFRPSVLSIITVQVTTGFLIAHILWTHCLVTNSPFLSFSLSSFPSHLYSWEVRMQG